MCACVRFAWALALRSCSQWPNAVGAVEVLEEDEGVLDLAIDESVFGFLRYSVLGAANFHQEVHVQALVYQHFCLEAIMYCNTGRLETKSLQAINITLEDRTYMYTHYCHHFLWLCLLFK